MINLLRLLCYALVYQVIKKGIKWQRKLLEI